jgi:poly-gamma-glutamate synthesis protein (capsule biosynthesis protein)
MKIPKTDKKNILIGLGGDMMIGRMVNDVLKGTGPNYLWGDIYPLFESCDLNLVNLEAALTTSSKKVPKVFNFKANPSRVDTLLIAPIHAVNLANNHTLDFSEEGLLETLQVLDAENIPHAGAGSNIDEAVKPIVLHCKGIKVGILGFTDNEPSWEASAASPGIAYAEINDKGAEKIEEKIKKLRPDVDIVILSMHWGPNMRQSPTKAFVNFAHRMINSGVDIFHGHSAHIFQGVEIYKKKPIFYDTGDLVDDYYVDPDLRNDQTFFFLVEAGKDGIASVRLVPLLIRDCQVNLAQGKEMKNIMERMQLLSENFNTEFTEEAGALVAKMEKEEEQ